MSNYCPTCGARAGAQKYCGACGAPLPAITPAGAPTVSFAGSGTASSGPAGPPPPPAPGPAAAPPVARPGILGPGRVDVGMLTLLSVLTLGIMWLIWVYQEIRIYRRLSGLTHPNLDNYYWAYVGTYAGTIVMSLVFAPLGWLVAIACVVVGALFLDAWMKDRDAVAARYGATGALTSRGGLMALWIGSNVAALTVVGLIFSIPLAIVLCVLIFQSHNRVVEAAQNAGVDWR